MAMALAVRVFDTQESRQLDLTFERFPVRVGRNQLNDLQLDKPWVSQFHAMIDVAGAALSLRDLGSTNGTMFAGARLPRDAVVDITAAPEFSIGPLVVRVALVERGADRGDAPNEREGFERSWAAPAAPTASVGGAEDAAVKATAPFVEAYRAAWAAAYRVLYENVTRMSPELRVAYVQRLVAEQPSLAYEPDFAKLARYYGIDLTRVAPPTPELAALYAIGELSRTLAPGARPPDSAHAVVGFARRLRDAVDVFARCYVSLRDGHKEFQAEVLARDRHGSGDLVARSTDARELCAVLLSPEAPPDAARQLHEGFVDVMTHQVGLLGGVMEGVRTLLAKLAPKTLEEELDRRGKKGGLFSNRHEALWRLYEERHGDYSGEDKQTFRIIFGPQFSEAYAKAAGEDYKSLGEGGPRLTRSITGTGGKR